MEPVDNKEIYSEDTRETGNAGTFNPKLIPIQRDSYLGEFLLWSESVCGSQVTSCFIHLLRLWFATVRRLF